MLILIAFVGAAIVAMVLWKAMSSARAGSESFRAQPPPHRQATGPVRPRVTGPDDDPEFLRRLSEQVRRPDDPPSS